MKGLRNSIPVGLSKVDIRDSFWSKYGGLVRDVVIPYQWEALNDKVAEAEPSHCVKNFKIAAGMEQGDYYGYVFQDSDAAKWLEAVGYSLQKNPDPELERTADEFIELIEKAQQKDGYLNTYYTVKEPGKRWTNLNTNHELYCAGHMIEAAVAYYNATGKSRLLEVVCRFADHIDSVFGPEPEKLKGYCGHEEIELALVKLYNATGRERYLKLARYFIDERGKEPYYFDIERQKRGESGGDKADRTIDREYNQSHLPVREQDRAVGHAVRAVYLYTGMADIAAATGDQRLLEACRRLWDNMVSRQMYITGGIGSTNHGEAFSFDYDLPNDTVYQETCASIGLVFFAHRMLQIEAKSCYADVMERALYNSVISGMALDGRSFFYVNPLEVWPEACQKSPIKRHVKPVRQKWFGCACCPPNIARLLSSLGEYIYTRTSDSVYTHLYIGGKAEIDLGGDRIAIEQISDYPWDGRIKMKIHASGEKEFTLGLRIPGWCGKAEIKINGKTAAHEDAAADGYVLLKRSWRDGDLVELELDMPVELVHSNPKVRSNAGKVAIQRGPLVYCLEEADNGENLSAVVLPPDTVLSAGFEEGLLGGVVTISGQALRTDEMAWDGELYRPSGYAERKTAIKAVPYCVWGNRKPGEMLVWVRHK